jgi:hypothetical protein
MRRLWWIAILVVIVSACGGGTPDSGHVAITSGEVESADGMATLSLPEGSLPTDVSVGDVTLEVIVDNNAVPGAPVVAVRLLPDGLVLSQPAVLTVALPELLDGGLIAIHQSGDAVEFLDGAVELQDDVTSFVAPITHFSVVSIHEFVFGDASVALTPPEVSEGQSQRANVELTRKSSGSDLILRFDSDPDDLVRKFVLSAPMPPIQVRSSTVKWVALTRPGESGVWEPAQVPIDFSKSEAGWTANASSTCVVENHGHVSLGHTHITFNVEILAASAPVDINIISFTSLATGAVDGGQSYSAGDLRLLESAPGDIIQAEAHQWAIEPNSCLAAGSTPPTTGSETAGSTTTTMRTDGGDPPNDQTDSSGNVYAEGEGNPGGDIVGVRHEPGPEGQQYFIIDVVADGQETSKGPHIYSVSISWEATDGEKGLATVKYDNGPPDAKLRSSDQGRPEIEGTLVTAEWEDSDTLRVCVDGGETKVEVESFRVQVNVVPGPGAPSWVDFALGLAG